MDPIHAMVCCHNPIMETVPPPPELICLIARATSWRVKILLRACCRHLFQALPMSWILANTSHEIIASLISKSNYEDQYHPNDIHGAAHSMMIWRAVRRLPTVRLLHILSHVYPLKDPLHWTAEVTITRTDFVHALPHVISNESLLFHLLNHVSGIKPCRNYIVDMQVDNFWEYNNGQWSKKALLHGIVPPTLTARLATCLSFSSDLLVHVALMEQTNALVWLLTNTTQNVTSSLNSLASCAFKSSQMLCLLHVIHDLGIEISPTEVSEACVDVMLRVAWKTNRPDLMKYLLDDTGLNVDFATVPYYMLKALRHEQYAMLHVIAKFATLTELACLIETSRSYTSNFNGIQKHHERAIKKMICASLNM